jgi:hypothetical protein
VRSWQKFVYKYNFLLKKIYKMQTITKTLLGTITLEQNGDVRTLSKYATLKIANRGEIIVQQTQGQSVSIFLNGLDTVIEGTGSVSWGVTAADLVYFLDQYFFFDVSGGGGGDDLATVLIAGNTSGANDIIFDAGQGLQFDNFSRLREGTIDAGTGGVKGIAQICGAGYELKWEAGVQYVMGSSGNTIRWSLYNFNNAPTVDDDNTKGYYSGSRWALDDGTWYYCFDATTGAAVWTLQSNAVPNLSQVLASGKSANGAIENLTYLEFDTAAAHTVVAGELAWNDTDGTLDLGLKGGNVTLQIGQEQVVRVVNKTATNVNLLEANYQAVRITGAQGQRLKVDLALATTDVLSAETIGLVTETINNNQEGFVTVSGLVRGINTTGSLQTETWADGDILYLSPTTAGNITNVKPVAPNHLIVIGYVVHAHITQGSIYVKVDNGYELDELHNVSIAGAANNDALIYESATALWKNKTIGGWNYIEKSANQDVTNNATLQDDTELQFSVVAGGKYMIEMDVVISMNNTTSRYSNRLDISAGTMKGMGIMTNISNAGSAQVTTLSAFAAANTAATSIINPSLDIDGLTSLKIIFSFTASANAIFKYKFSNLLAAVGGISRTSKGSILKYKKIN